MNRRLNTATLQAALLHSIGLDGGRVVVAAAPEPDDWHGVETIMRVHKHENKSPYSQRTTRQIKRANQKRKKHVRH